MKNNIAIVVALIISLVVTIFTYKILVNQNTTVTEQAQVSVYQVLVFNKNIKSSTALKTQDFSWIRWQGEEINTELGYIYQHKNPEGIEKYIGSMLKAEVRKGQLVSIDMLSDPKEEGALSMIITPGKRALSIPIKEVYNGLSGLVFPKDRVDLMFSYTINNAETNEQCSATQLLLENILVLSTDARLNKVEVEEDALPNNGNNETPAENITIEVDLKQAKKILLALKTGEVSLILRNSKDKVITHQNEIATQAVFSENGLVHLPDCSSSKKIKTPNSPSLSDKVTPGKRALSIPIKEVYNGLSGLVFPNDRVDLMLSYTSEECSATQLLAENILVLSTDSRLENSQQVVSSNNGDNEAPAQNITVEVNFTQIKNILLALKVGEISLILRNENDNILTKQTNIATQEVFAKDNLLYMSDCTPRQIPSEGEAAPGAIFRGN
jgi:pilus assembly protein CpaB